MFKHFKLLWRGTIWKPESAHDSNIRRVATFAIWIYASAIWVPHLIWGYLSLESWLARWLLILPTFCASLAYFVFVVLLIPFKASRTFAPNAWRLLVDAATSALLTTIAFAMAYNVWGIVGPDGTTPTATDYYYFSVVTFSTLGFGDFRPEQGARMLAALQSVIGNVHLGLVVGAAFLAARNAPAR